MYFRALKTSRYSQLSLAFLFYFGRWAKCCDQYVCLSVCISRKHVRMLPNFLYMLHCGRSLLLLWRQCNRLCTSGFVDDVMFSHNACSKLARIKGDAYVSSSCQMAASGSKLLSTIASLFLFCQLVYFFKNIQLNEDEPDSQHGHVMRRLASHDRTSCNISAEGWSILEKVSSDG